MEGPISHRRMSPRQTTIVARQLSQRESAPPARLEPERVELPGGGDRPAAAGLVPGDGDVDEALVEVSLLGRCGSPRQLELLVRGEVAAGPQRLQAPLVRTLHRVLPFRRGDDPAL